MDGDVRVNPYLTGNFAPVRSEDDFVLKLQGELPPALAGTLYRNGPNPQFAPRDDNHHWFFGDGMIHAFDIRDGAVSYRNRWVRTAKWEAEHQAGEALFGTWGNPMTSDPSILGTDGGVANTNIIFHGGRLLALEEAHAPFELQPRTLAPRGPFNLGGRVTAHPKFDPATGEMIFFAYADDDDMPLSTRVAWGIADSAGTLLRRETFEAPYCSMIHDFAITQNHVIIPVLPLIGDIGRAIAGGPVFAWEPDRPAMLAVMRRDKGVASLRWFELPACYVFHVMNAFEAGDEIIIDVMQYDSAPLFPLADGSPGTAGSALLTRWHLPLTGATNAVTQTQLDDLGGEFPRFDLRVEGQAYRHGWFAGRMNNQPRVVTDSIAHIDLATGRRTSFSLPAGDAISEPVFVPATPDAPEAEGWLLAVAYRAANDTSDLLVLNATDVAAGPIAMATLPRRVPFGFHGNWVQG